MPPSDAPAAEGLRVAHVITTLNVGGAERLLLDLCRRLPDMGVTCAVAYLKGPGPMEGAFRDAGVPVARVPLMAAIDPSAVPRLARVLRGWAPDIVHTHMFKADLHGWMAGRQAGVGHFVSTKHAAEEQRRAGAVSAVDRWLAARSDAVVCVSRNMADFTAQVEGFPCEKLRVIYGGVDTASFAQPRPDGRSRWGIDEKTPVVLSASRLHSSKALDVLIEAMRLVRDELPGAVLVLAGDGEERRRLAELAAPDGDRVRFLGTREDVADLLWSSDCFVLSSRREGLGLSLVEAMAALRPCVGTRAGGIPEIIRDGETGLLVPPGDPPALAAAIVRLLTDADEAASLARAASADVRERFDVSRAAREYASLYGEIADRS